METIQRTSSISFPFLGDWSINPPSYFTVLGKNIYFYGVIIACAFIIGIIYCYHNSKRVNLTEDDLSDMFILMIPLSIIGARIYFVIFNLDYYISHPGEILAIWNGGLAIYGGIIMGAIVIFLVCRHKKISFFSALDLIFPACILGQAIGRWGNFMNREAFGRETDVFCKMGLTNPLGETIYVHPTFLYESLWNFIGFLFLNHVVKKCRKYDGEVALLYLAWYGLGRMFIEGLRTDSLYIGSTGIRVSQALSAVLIVFASVFLIINHLKLKKSSEDI